MPRQSISYALTIAALPLLSRCALAEGVANAQENSERAAAADERAARAGELVLHNDLGMAICEVHFLTSEEHRRRAVGQSSGWGENNVRGTARDASHSGAREPGGERHYSIQRGVAYDVLAVPCQWAPARVLRNAVFGESQPRLELSELERATSQ